MDTWSSSSSSTTTRRRVVDAQRTPISTTTAILDPLIYRYSTIRLADSSHSTIRLATTTTTAEMDDQCETKTTTSKTTTTTAMATSTPTSRTSEMSEEHQLRNLERTCRNLNCILEFDVSNDKNKNNNNNNNNNNNEHKKVVSSVHLQWNVDNTHSTDDDDDDNTLSAARSFEPLEVLWNLKYLQTLELIDFRHSTIPSQIGNLYKTLNYLKFDYCSLLEQIPPEIGRLQNLERLSIDSCPRLSALPSEIGSLTKLTEFSIVNNASLSTLPAMIGNLEKLSILTIEACRNLTSLPAEIGQLSNLTKIIVREVDQLTTLPDAFLSNLHSLKSLTLKRCTSLRSLDNVSFLGLHSLKSVTIGSCPHLEQIPVGLKYVQTLKRLHFWVMPRETILKFFDAPWPTTTTTTTTTATIGSNNNNMTTATAAAAANPRGIDIVGAMNEWRHTGSSEAENKVLTSDDVAKILSGLPKSLKLFNLTGQGIDDLSVFLKSKNKHKSKNDQSDNNSSNNNNNNNRKTNNFGGLLPVGLSTLSLYDNPILRSTKDHDQQSLYKLLEHHPRLGHVVDHPERATIFTEESRHLLFLNRCGMVLLRGGGGCGGNNNNNNNNNDENDDTNFKSNKPIPTSMWPTVLDQVKRRIDRGHHHESIRMEASVIYSLLHGPALLDRQQQQHHHLQQEEEEEQQQQQQQRCFSDNKSIVPRKRKVDDT